MFRTVRQKTVDGKWWYPPPHINKLFRYRKFSETQHRMVPLRKFWALSEKNFRRKILILLPPSYPITFSLREIFWNTAQKGSPTKFFGTARQKDFDRKLWYSRLRRKIFRYSKLSETQKGSSTKWFSTVRQNNFDRKSWYPPPLSSVSFFDTRNFLKHRKVLLRNFSALWDKKNFNGKSWYPFA